MLHHFSAIMYYSFSNLSSEHSEESQEKTDIQYHITTQTWWIDIQSMSLHYLASLMLSTRLQQIINDADLCNV